MKRWLKWLGLGFAALILLVLVFVALVLTTEWGARFALNQAQGFAPGELSIERVEGSLSGPLTLYGIHYSHAGLAVTAKRLRLDIDLSALFQGTAHIESLSLQHAIVNLPPPEPAPVPEPNQPFELPEINLPLAVDIDALEAADVQIVPHQGKPIVIQSLALDAGFEAGALNVDRLALESTLGDLNLAGQVDTLDAYQSDLEATFALRRNETLIEGQLSLQGDLNEMHVALQLDGPQAMQLTAVGDVGLSGANPVVDLDARWRAVEFPIAPDQVLRSPMGEITIAGTRNDYQLAAELRVAGAVPAGHWQIQGHGSTDAFTVERMNAQTLEGRIAGSGKITWAPQLAWQLHLNTQNINPQALAPAWAGRLGVDLDTQGERQSGGFVGTLNLHTLSGQLRGHNVRAQADVQFEVSEGVQNIRGEVQLYSGENEILASGHYGRQTDVRLELDLPRLQDLYPGASGALQGELKLTGAPGSLTLTGALQGENTAFAENRVSQFSTRFDLSQEKLERSQLTLHAQGIQAAGLAVNQLDLNFAGTRAQHQLALSAMGEAGTLDLNLAGGLQNQLWQGEIKQLKLASKRAGVWRLREPAILQAGTQLASLEQFCLASDRGELCATGQWQQESGLKADLNINQVPLAAAEPLLAQALAIPAQVEGFLNGEVHVNMTPGQVPAINAQIAAENAALHLTQAGTVHSLTFKPLRARLELDDGRLRGELDLVIEELGSVRAAVQSPSVNMDALAASPVNGSVMLNIRTLAPLSPLLGPLVETDGRITGEVTIDGSLRAVNLGGEIQLREFTTRVPAAGLQLTNGRLTLQAAGEQLDFDGAVTSGEGELLITGQALFPAGAPVQVRAEIQGERFLAADMPGVEVYISPLLDASVEGKRIELTGEVKIPEATIDLGELEGGGPETVDVSPDVVVVGTEQEEAGVPVQLYAEIDIILGEDIEIVGQGFEGGVDGRLHVSVEPGEPALGSGELLISGTYQAYGQDLTIREGRLLYSDSPLDNPGLAITAVRVVDDVTAGVRISGTAKYPELTLFSDPPLGSDAEVLSYLVLGKPLNQASDGEGLNLQRKATLKGAGLLAKQLGARLGIEGVAVEETDTGTSVVSIGRYLSPRLYLSYGVGILEPVSIVKLQYELSDLWTLQASSGTETRAGIQFELEN